MSNYQYNQRILNAIDGNTMLIDPITCPECDCLNAHACLVCDRTISAQVCHDNYGLCKFCVNNDKE